MGRISQEPVELAADGWGSGPPVVFLHGIGGSARYWRPLARVSTGYRGVAPDLLGFGRSPKPRAARYDVREHLAALTPLVPPGSTLVAHSTGAVLAGALATRRPDLVSRLLLVGAPLYADVDEARTEVRQLGRLARITATGELAGRAACLVLHGLVRPVSPLLPTALPDGVVQDFWEHSWRSYSRTLRRVVVEHPLVPDLAGLRIPATLLYGDRDETASRGPLAGLLRRNDRLRAVEIPGDHHVAALSPGPVAEALHAVLAQPPSYRDEDGAG